MNAFSPFPLTFDTPVQKLKKTSAKLRIDLRAKLEQYIPYFGGGSKARKILPILNTMLSSGCDAVVTAGSASSNHARVTALACAQMGLKCKLIIHDTPDYSKANLRIMRMTGAELIFCKLSDVAGKMDAAMEHYTSMGLKPYYIWGGGHSVEGAFAYYHALKEFSRQVRSWTPDYIIIPSGTGGTQAGIHLAAEEMYPSCKVIGISVARKSDKGRRAVEKSISDLKEYLGVKSNANEIVFMDEWVGGGYGEFSLSVNEIISYAAEAEGILLDPIYTAKAFLSIFEMVRDKKIYSGSKVLFWHTGSPFNLFKIKE